MGPVRLRSGQASPLRNGRLNSRPGLKPHVFGALFAGLKPDASTDKGKDEIRGSLRYATDDETVRCSGRDGEVFGGLR